ncbi:MAG: glycosyltransferase [Candidatus Omnitrophota bacterium]|nr:glycosyltransferase [Candidatus Omnitrophota bacterium]
MDKIAILVFRIDSADAGDFQEELCAYSKNSLLLLFDSRRIIVKYHKEGIRFKKNTFRFYRGKNKKLNYLFAPFLLLLDNFLMIKIFSSIFLKYRPRICWMENLYVAVFIVFLKKLNLFKTRLIYLPNDWLVNPSYKRIWSYFGNNFIYPFLDYVACRFSDEVIYCDQKLAQARYNFWARKLAKKEKSFSQINFPGLKIKANNSDTVKNAICFLGDMRMDSGLDLAIKSLSYLSNDYNIILKIIGPIKYNYDYFEKLTKKYKVEKYVEFVGFVEVEHLTEVLSGCFCGINVLTSINSYSNYAIPGKQIHYLQFLLPILTTENAGTLVPLIKEKGLGLVINPKQLDFNEAVIKIYKEQAKYRENIINFINCINRVNIRELIEI